MRLNNKGFTLVEVLAVVIILGVLATIMIPTVSFAIKKYKEDSYKNLEKSIISAAKVYMSDNRYNITLGSNQCVNDNDNDTRDILKISNTTINDNKLLVRYLKLSGDIKSPITNQLLDINNSYVVVKGSCKSSDYIYEEGFDCSDNTKSCLNWSNS